MPRNRATSHIDPDDLFADTRMSFGDHIEELRVHLWRAIWGFLVGLVISFFIGEPVLRLIAAPVEQELAYFYKRRVERIQQRLEQSHEASLEAINAPKEIPLEVDRVALAQALGLPAPPQTGEHRWVSLPARIPPLTWAIVTSEAYQMIGRPPVLATLSITEAFMVYIKVCIVCGIVIGSPWIFWQLWSFVAAGLYPHEKRYVNVYLPFSLGLFLTGFFMCELFVIPQTIRILLGFNEWIGLEPDLRLSEWLSFALLLPLIFGLTFQTPLVMLFLAKLGILDVQSFRGKRRLAWFVMAILAAALTPTPDAPTMLFMWAPMCALYELGIILAKYAAPSEEDSEVTDSQELVEV